MEGEGVRITLPEQLVERILAMLPFPYILKARALSKSWLARFSQISSHDNDEEKRCSAVAFQKTVGEFSLKWRTFSPVYIGDHGLIAYDGSSQRWQNIPSLPFINLLPLMWHSRTHIGGALMLIPTPLYSMTVANVLTRSWKILPSPPPREDECESRVDGKLVNHMDTYKVIYLYHHRYYFRVAMYDSLLGSWSTKRIDVSEDLRFFSENGEYLNGDMYWVCEMGTTGTYYLLTFNFKDETFEVLEMAPTDILLRFDVVELVVCNGSLLLVVYDEEGYLENGSIWHETIAHEMSVLEIDLGSRRLLEVTDGPPNSLNFGGFRKSPGSDGNSIYFTGQDANEALAYNVRTDEWSCFPIPVTFHKDDGRLPNQTYPSSFQPGLNPFIAV